MPTKLSQCQAAKQHTYRQATQSHPQRDAAGTKLSW